MAQQGPPNGWTPVAEDTSAWTPVQEAATPPPAPASALSRFGEGFLRTNPLSTTASLASGLWTDPKGTVEQAVFAPVAREAGLAKQSFLQGQPLAALGHAAGAIPLVGPPIAATVERAQSGDVAGAMGEATGMAATMGLLKPGVKAVGGAAADVGRQIPGAPEFLAGAGERANRFSTREMTKATAPTGGPNKANLTAIAERIAPQLARAPELKGVATHGGLISAVENGLDSAREGLDQTLDQTLMQTHHPTDPIIKGLEAEQGKLVVQGNKGGMIPTPDRQTKFTVLQDMIDKVKALGDTATYENLRNLRQSWDAPAAASKIYAKTEAEFAQKHMGQAYADGASVLRDYLAGQEPAAAKANAAYSLWINAHKVLRAGEQASVTQSPGTGQALVTRGLGVLAGKGTGGGIPAEIAGALVAPMLDRALSSVKTGFKIKVSQQFAALADALASGKPAAIAKQTQTLKQMLPPMGTALRIGSVQGRFVGAPPAGTEPTQEEEPPPSTPGRTYFQGISNQPPPR